MPSIDRTRRLLRLFELLQAGQPCNTQQMAEACGVSRRTIFRDLKLLQESGLPVHYDKSRQTYSLPAEVHLPATGFSMEEALCLLILCLELGHQESGIPLFEPARSAALKLLSNLPLHLREHIGDMEQSMSLQVEPRNPLRQAKDHFDQLTRALRERRRLRMRYYSLTEWEEITTELHPYRLFFSRRSWYAIGYSSLHGEPRTFNVGRITESELLRSRYTIPKDFSLEGYLNGAWHLINEGERHQVRVRFQPMVATNVAEVHWHSTQQITWNEDGTMDYRVTVSSLKEIRWWILGYGDQAEVLEPPELREAVRQRAEAMATQYQGDGLP